MKINLLRVRRYLIPLLHLGIIAGSIFLAFWLRFDFSLASIPLDLLIRGLVVVAPIKTATFILGGLNKGWWQYVGVPDLVRVFLVNLAATALSTVGIVSLIGPQFPRAIYAIDFLICFLLCSGARFSVRLYNEILKSQLSKPGKGILIYGAGSAGRTLAQEVRKNPSLGLQVLGFIDDEQSLKTSRILDVPVLGAGRDIASIIENNRGRIPAIDEIVIAMPSASSRQMREAHANCRAAGVPCKTVPGIGDLLSGNYLSAQIRNVSVNDLLGREPIALEEKLIQQSIEGRSIMVTGAGGSIGSELCRQVAGCFPAKLVALDQSESDLFKIDEELRRINPDVEIVPVVADIRDIDSIDLIVRRHGVESIYHAAAYKHVPMMESHVVEAARNNIVGTWNLVQVAHKYKVRNFLMISSDKAVNPTSVMGATKRVAELIVGASNRSESGTKFVSVRFGNVLGSKGSVVPTFQAQIAAGGPITVTHPEMRRYFMSIREAVLLVLQASTMGKGSEIFVLDMGEPVRILDLAHNLIQLAGLVPEEDIEVRITGLRPGEKLNEELTMDGENVEPTHHEKIRIFKGVDNPSEEIDRWMSQLRVLLEARDSEKIIQHIQSLVPEYRPKSLRESVPTIPESVWVAKKPVKARANR